jgi:hypothetical protein
LLDIEGGHLTRETDRVDFNTESAEDTEKKRKNTLPRSRSSP